LQEHFQPRIRAYSSKAPQNAINYTVKKTELVFTSLFLPEVICVYRPKLVGKPLVLDVTLLLRKIQDAIQGMFKTYPVGTIGTSGIVGHSVSANVRDVRKAERDAKLRAESWKGALTTSMLRNSLR